MKDQEIAITDAFPDAGPKAVDDMTVEQLVDFLNAYRRSFSFGDYDISDINSIRHGLIDTVSRANG